MNWDEGHDHHLPPRIMYQQSRLTWQYFLTSMHSLDPTVLKAQTMQKQHGSGECGSEHAQYNLPHENVRQTEMSLKDNSGLRYRGKKNGIKAKQWPASVEWALCREFYFVLYARNLDPTLCVKQEPALWRGADQDHSHYCAGSQTSEAYHQAQ